MGILYGLVDLLKLCTILLASNHLDFHEGRDKSNGQNHLSGWPGASVAQASRDWAQEWRERPDLVGLRGGQGAGA